MGVQGYVTIWEVCISLCQNSVCILFISSEWIGIFLTKFGSSDPNYNRSILTLLYFKFEAFVHAQSYSLIHIIHKFFLMICYLKLKLRILFDKWSCSMVFSTWLLFLKIYSSLLIFPCFFSKFYTTKCQLCGLFNFWHFY